eukprot:TRINITY_DN1236_c0_g1_i10.p1 TRINITY_DN1236_c0_g1~~TRINITY_DN1236_c0_g1_i10.p1  ORF type:complete len:499 (+),score=104.67 TRINITY_DN1236_c0_g1_i10:1804-3300(+)
MVNQSALQGELRALKDENSALQQECRLLRSNIDKINNNNENTSLQYEEKIQILSCEKDSLTTKVSYFHDHVQSLEAKIDLLKQGLLSMKMENQELSESHSASRRRSENTMSEQNNQLEAMSLRYSRLLSQEQEHMEERNRMQQEINTLTSSVEEYHKKYESLNVENESLKSSSNKLEKEVTELKQMNVSIRNNSKQSLIKLEEQTSKDTEAVRLLRNVLKEKDEELVSLRGQLSQPTQSPQQTKYLKEKEEQIASLREQLTQQTIESLTQEDELITKIELLESQKLQASNKFQEADQARISLLRDKEQLTLQLQMEKALHNQIHQNQMHIDTGNLDLQRQLNSLQDSLRQTMMKNHQLNESVREQVEEISKLKRRITQLKFSERHYKNELIELNKQHQQVLRTNNQNETFNEFLELQATSSRRKNTTVVKGEKIPKTRVKEENSSGEVSTRNLVTQPRQRRKVDKFFYMVKKEPESPPPKANRKTRSQRGEVEWLELV